MSDTKKPADGDILEIDAIDEAEWEQDKHTPTVHNEQLSQLVKQSAAAEPPKPPPVPKRATGTVATVKRASTVNAVPATVKRATTANAAPVKGSGTNVLAAKGGATDAVPAKGGATNVVPAKGGATNVVPAKDRAATTQPAAAGASKPADAASHAKPAAADPSPGAKLVADANDASSSGVKPATGGRMSPTAFSGVAAKATAVPGRAVSSSDSGGIPSVRATTSGSAGIPSVRATTSGSAGIPSVRVTTSGSAGIPSVRATTSGSTGIPSVRETTDTPSTPRKLPLPAPRSTGRTAPPPLRTGAVAASPAPTHGTQDVADAPMRVAQGQEFAHTPTSEPAVLASPIETTAEAAPLPGAAESAARSADASAARSADASAARSADASAARDGGDASGANVAVAPNAGPGPNPFDEHVWRAEGGSDSQADAAGAYPVVGGNPVREAIVAFVKNRRNLAIAAGAGVLLIISIVLATGGDTPPRSEKQANATAQPTSAPDVEPRAAEQLVAEQPSAPSAAERGGEAAHADATGDATHAGTSDGSAHDTASGSAQTDTTATADSATAAPPATATANRDGKTARAAAPAKKKSPTLAGKQVVLEYDAQAREDKPVANAAAVDQDAIRRARSAYNAGNSRLFAGDSDGAIRHYRQALAHYPAYVAGYRGLGLAYAQKGDKANALKALRTYVNAVPGAKDAPLIRRRIEALAGK